MNKLAERLWEKLACRLKIFSYKDREYLLKQIEDSKILAANSLINQMKSSGISKDLHEVEFKVFSQFGDDGIIQYLIHHAEIENDVFIEIGVQDYLESNTRFLLVNNNWSGLVIDASPKHIKFIKRDEIYWKHDLTAVCTFVDRNNISNLIADFIEDRKFSPKIGILSIDIDGNDYWMWDAINNIEPSIVIVEYNSVFGIDHAVSVPYDPKFFRPSAHYSHLYWGASLKAFYLLARRKGYHFLGCCMNGINAYFVKESCLGKLQPVSLEEGYVVSKFRDSRNERGELSFLTGIHRRKAIEELFVDDVESGRCIKLKHLWCS
jgi:hypothetical protein